LIADAASGALLVGPAGGSRGMARLWFIARSGRRRRRPLFEASTLRGGGLIAREVLVSIRRRGGDAQPVVRMNFCV